MHWKFIKPFENDRRIMDRKMFCHSKTHFDNLIGIIIILPTFEHNGPTAYKIDQGVKK